MSGNNGHNVPKELLERVGIERHARRPVLLWHLVLYVLLPTVFGFVILDTGREARAREQESGRQLWEYADQVHRTQHELSEARQRIVDRNINLCAARDWAPDVRFCNAYLKHGIGASLMLSGRVLGTAQPGSVIVKTQQCPCGEYFNGLLGDAYEPICIQCPELP
jgi:hypothetical protein